MSKSRSDFQGAVDAFSASMATGYWTLILALEVQQRFLRDNRGVLAQLAEPIRAACRAEKGRKVDRPTADSEARRGSACI